MSATWESLNIAAELQKTLEKNGIGQPTSVQAEAVPALLEGRSVSARSQTGSGKTLAFLLPVLQRVDSSRTDVQAIIIAPTQELAMQIVRVAETYGEPLGVRVQSLIGGAALKRQVERLKLKPQLVIGTPGRINELVQTKKLRLHEASFVVVDEADQVFDLGSSRELEAVLKSTKHDRQIAFFSATYPKVMAELEAEWMKEPVRISITPEHRVAASIRHFFLICDKREKTDIARRVIRLLNPKSALLFLNDTDNVANWESKLSFEGFSVETLYGDANKMQRVRTLERFRDGRCQLLLATDIAARGLDIEGLPLVVNLDPPVDADHYVHRAGRTGRMGREGTVVSIVTPQELFIMDKFQKQLGIDLPQKVMSHGKLVDANEQKRRPSDAEHSAGAPVRMPQQPRRAAAQPGEHGRGSGPAPARKPAKAAQTPHAKPAVKSKAERERLRKNKGAPKWLKAKRDGENSGPEI